MKTLVVNNGTLHRAGRWDIDYHLPPVGIQKFPKELLKRVSACADVIKSKRDPTLQPDTTFLYIDISSVDVGSGVIRTPQELVGEEAPSRARKVVHAFDIIISTCRPTRGAIAIVPKELHGQICSTGFSVIRAKEAINPFYLQFALRLESTLEQFRKWATGSSYPAILDDDVAKTLIPLPDRNTQDAIAYSLRCAEVQRERTVAKATGDWRAVADGVLSSLQAKKAPPTVGKEDVVSSIAQVTEIIATLPKVNEQAVSDDEDLLERNLFSSDEQVEPD